MTGMSRTPLVAAGAAVAIALTVAGVWCGRRAPVSESALEATISVRIVKHDSNGIPGKPEIVRDPPRVRAIVTALGVEAHPPAACPPDYATAEVGLHLAGRDVYAKRDVYLWSLAGEPSVVTVTAR